MKTKSKVIYPLEILKYSEEERNEKFSREVKYIDINTIKHERVYLELKNMLNY